jgi:hypothetical protein
MPHAKNEPRLLTVPQAAKRAGRGVNQFRAACKAGQVPTVTIGERLYVPAQALDKLLGGGPL